MQILEDTVNFVDHKTYFSLGKCCIQFSCVIWSTGVLIRQTEAFYCTTILLRKYLSISVSSVNGMRVPQSAFYSLKASYDLQNTVFMAAHKSVSCPHTMFHKKLPLQQTGVSPTACRHILQGSILKRLHHTRNEHHTHLSIYWNKHECCRLLHHCYIFIHWRYGPQFMIWMWFCFNYMQVEL